MTCAACQKPRPLHARGLCSACYVAQRRNRARKPGQTKRAPPECWCCGTPAPSGSHLAKAGWVERRTPEGACECYCAACMAKWGWPPLTGLPYVSWAGMDSVPPEKNRVYVVTGPARALLEST